MLRSHITTAKGTWPRLLVPLLACLIGLAIALGTLPGLAPAPAESPTLAELENPAAVHYSEQTDR
jgi:fumarate reductase subunit D